MLPQSSLGTGTSLPSPSRGQLAADQGQGLSPCALEGRGSWPRRPLERLGELGRGFFSYVTRWPLVTTSLTFSSFQDMFDPHGWTEDSYYEALGT